MSISSNPVHEPQEIKGKVLVPKKNCPYTGATKDTMYHFTKTPSASQALILVDGKWKLLKDVDFEVIEYFPETLLQDMPLSSIGNHIKKYWTNMYFGAVPYVAAMRSLRRISDTYGIDSGSSIVAYALSNMTNWKGTRARVVKAELKRRLKAKK